MRAPPNSFTRDKNVLLYGKYATDTYSMSLKKRNRLLHKREYFKKKKQYSNDLRETNKYVIHSSVAEPQLGEAKLYWGIRSRNS